MVGGNNANKDAHRVDIVCMSLKARMCPGMEVEEIARKYNSEKEFKQEWTTARVAIEEELNDDSILPTFCPASEVQKVSSYGFIVYEKYALLPESQVVALTGKTPLQLGLEKWTSETQPISFVFRKQKASS